MGKTLIFFLVYRRHALTNTTFVHWLRCIENPIGSKLHADYVDELRRKFKFVPLVVVINKDINFNCLGALLGGGGGSLTPFVAQSRFSRNPKTKTVYSK